MSVFDKIKTGLEEAVAFEQGTLPAKTRKVTTSNEGETMSGEICTDNRFEIIARYKAALLDGTNISNSPDEMAVIDTVLFRFWQLGWLKDVPRTHGDYIRLMTDEELADFLPGKTFGYNCPPEHNGCPGECVPCWLEWLKQEVDDGT